MTQAKDKNEMFQNMPSYYPNAYDTIGRRIYVAQNHPAADDNNPGTFDKPFKTIAASVSKLNKYDRVFIGRGIYRETIPIREHGHYYVPRSHVHFHAYDGEEVYIKGSDEFAGQWESRGEGIYEAALPANLFVDGIYNPYVLRCAVGEHETVRPCPDSELLPLTLGQIYVNGWAHRQVGSIDAVKSQPHTFMIPAAGKTIFVNFGSLIPTEQLVELTVRKRCFESHVEGAMLIQTHDICVEHAAEPGPFCKDRPMSIRRNACSVDVMKEYVLPGPVGNGCTLMSSSPSYRSSEDDTLIAGIIDDTRPVRFTETECVVATSDDIGRTWTVDESTRERTDKKESPGYFLDERTNTLMKYWREYPNGNYFRGAFGHLTHNVMFAFSRNGGKTWSKPKLIDNQKKYFYKPCALEDGRYLWSYVYNVNKPDTRPRHYDYGTLIGRWNENGTDILWQPGGGVHVEPHESACGLSEPSVVQFADGRLIAFFRAGSMLASQSHPGVPSVKLFSISEDGGKNWTHPEPLCYDDGEYIYSPRAYHLAIRSTKNGRVYLAMNITDRPCYDCDPRTHLYLAEVDSATLRVSRDRLILVEAIHPEHHYLVRYSNFQLIEDRQSGNPVIFMKLAVSESCPVLCGYDQNFYRYEIQM